jgi:hypothetical protein
LPLLLSFGAVDVALELLEGVPDAEELVLPDDGVADDEAFESDDGGVPGALDDDDGVDDEDDVSGALVLGVADDDDDDIEPLVAGGVVVDDDEDVDGDGVTTGGVVPVVDDVSRLQPAIPRTRPLASSVTMRVFIAISNVLIKGCPPRN